MLLLSLSFTKILVWIALGAISAMVACIIGANVKDNDVAQGWAIWALIFAVIAVVSGILAALVGFFGWLI